ncbi:helix-turn-helix domain-containing protein [Variovorax sp. dw_954]|uniref:IclR family transcriptional regulator n=1 Tax=Variovorax sp. dw_954 TaxID=2720078 RepID=UPI001BD4E250|nr:helix-turn-helix domain-containing protein [Variovorax sp. dw_954]
MARSPPSVPSKKPSTRSLTRQSGTFTRSTAGSQSLVRGLDLLRAFLPSVPALTNAELAERTGLPRPTISRLTNALVGAGFLVHEAQTGAYRLAPVHLSLGVAFRQTKSELALALPLMRKVAVAEKINVGLSTPDGLAMVYLETLRESRGPVQRQVTAGIRLAIESNSPGHAYLAALDARSRQRILKALEAQHGARWPALRKDIDKSLASHTRLGYCRSDAIPGMSAIAAGLRAPDRTFYAINFSLSAKDGDNEPLVQRCAPVLRKLVEDVQRAWDEMARVQAPAGST